LFRLAVSAPDIGGCAIFVTAIMTAPSSAAATTMPAAIHSHPLRFPPDLARATTLRPARDDGFGVSAADFLVPIGILRSLRQALDQRRGRGVRRTYVPTA
jgi:hypothetical protein